MNRPLGLLCRAGTNVVFRQNCSWRTVPLRRYVNWTPEKPSSNKKARIQPPPGQPRPTDEPASKPEQTFQNPPPSEQANSSSPEPQLLRLKNNKTSEQWEKEWTERVWRAGQVTLIVGVFMTAYAIGAGYVHLPYGMNYRPNTLPKEGSEEETQYLKKVENALHSLPIVKKLSADKNWIKTIGIFAIPKEDLRHNLTMGVLAGIGRITVKPVTFYNPATKEFVAVMHVGQDVCGHRGLVHGGFLATVLDECLGKTVRPLKNIADAGHYHVSERI